MANYFYDLLPAEEMTQLSYIPTVPEFVTWIEKKWGDLPAVSDTNVTYSYKEFCSRIARRRALLGGLGLKKGDKVAIWERSSIDAIEMFLAATSAGYVGILLPTQLPSQAVIGCCAKFGVSVLAVRGEFAEQAAGAPCKVISSSEMAGTEAPVATVSKDDPAAIFFTGGTTGAPKGAILPHRALMRGSFNGVFAPGKQLGCHREIAFLPLSHVFGLIRNLMSSLYTGSALFICRNNKDMFRDIAMFRPTIWVVVPALAVPSGSLPRI